MQVYLEKHVFVLSVDFDGRGETSGFPQGHTLGLVKVSTHHGCVGDEGDTWLVDRLVKELTWYEPMDLNSREADVILNCLQQKAARFDFTHSFSTWVLLVTTSHVFASALDPCRMPLCV